MWKSKNAAVKNSNSNSSSLLLDMSQASTTSSVKNQYLEILERYVPESTAQLVYQWIQDYKIRLKITRARRSKLGDYRPPISGGLHQISVNHDLNKFAFLITLTHELAHLITWEQHKHNVAPHGQEWKNAFSTLLIDFIGKGVFPSDIEEALLKYIENPKASSCTDQNLYKVLRRYDAAPSIHLDEISAGSIFALSNGEIYRKGAKRRTRFLCQHIASKKLYYVSGIAEVKVLNQALPFEA